MLSTSIYWWDGHVCSYIEIFYKLKNLDTQDRYLHGLSKFLSKLLNNTNRLPSPVWMVYNTVRLIQWHRLWGPRKCMSPPWFILYNMFFKMVSLHFMFRYCMFDIKLRMRMIFEKFISHFYQITKFQLCVKSILSILRFLL